MPDVSVISEARTPEPASGPRVSSSAMLDPALFGAPYDFMLAEALGHAGMRVELVARPPRPVDPAVPRGFTYLPFFSRVSESVRGHLPPQLFSAVKGAEYVVDCERLVAYLRRTRPSVVHYLWLPFAVRDVQIIRRLRQFLPIVYTMHNKVPFHGAALSLQRIFRSEWLQLFDTIIVHTVSAREYIEATGYPGERVFVYRHPPLSLAEPTARDRALIPPKRKFRVLMWGAFKPYKGADALLDASKRLWSQGIEHELALVGNMLFDMSSQLETVRDRQAAGDLILEFGPQDESRITAHIEAADIVVFPYREIDASGALMATLARNKPVLATSVGGFAELKELYGTQLTFSVPPDDVSALAGRLAELITQPRALFELATDAQNLLDRHGSWADMRDGTNEAYSLACEVAAARIGRAKGA